MCIYLWDEEPVQNLKGTQDTLLHDCELLVVTKRTVDTSKPKWGSSRELMGFPNPWRQKEPTVVIRAPEQDAFRWDAVS